ncbi:hypothetical protein ABZ379_29860 [Streptomyces canus]
MTGSVDHRRVLGTIVGGAPNLDLSPELRKRGHEVIERGASWQLP